MIKGREREEEGEVRGEKGRGPAPKYFGLKQPQHIEMWKYCQCNTLRHRAIGHTSSVLLSTPAHGNIFSDRRSQRSSCGMNILSTPSVSDTSTSS